MDRNQAIGLMLMALLLLLYFQFFSPEPPKEEPRVQTEQVTESNSPELNAGLPAQEDPSLPDSLFDEVSRQRLGIFAAGARGTEEEVAVENSQVALTFSTLGAQVATVELKDFTTYDGKPLYILTPETSRIHQRVNADNRVIDLTELYYQKKTWSDNDTSYISFTLPLPSGAVEHIYSLPPSGYQVGYELKLNGARVQESVDFNWRDNLIKQEKDITLSRTNSTINYYTTGGDFDGLAERSTSLEEKSIEEPLKWVSIKQRFFVAAMIASDRFTNVEVKTQADLADSSIVKEAQVAMSVPLENSATGWTYYFGPNDYHILKDVTEDFSKNLYLGWPPMIWVNKFVIIPLFDLLNNFIGNYGLIIIIMVLMIKLVLSPLSYKSYLSMAKMKVLKPEMDAIKEKHGDDMSASQQETMKLYQQVGVNPVSGCVPMLLQMPILFAMFYFFPQSIELRGKPFLWAEDLSTYDTFIQLPFTIPFYGSHVSLFVLLMTVSTILYTWSNQQVSTVQGPMKAFTYMMPLIFMFVLNSYPAALSFYYFVSNLVTFGQQAVIRKFVDDDKIRAILEENKKNAGSRKKSKFQQRLEAAMKAQQQQQQEKPKKKKK
ncbi:membrane protein insertase YidC [Fulvivirga sedimenti]|uniref:Membrane protein insertase YidC n=1 Tax=Fulvivirga sedimenti TaxID=2879465 RepID=A0A9X1HMK7_9BACT|nr:membrane protein insertase YidC [Fulvivirga sedimenti]MCA6073598.1 membrane protein insertase YidC [Fulvivirga sedimenti]